MNNHTPFHTVGLWMFAISSFLPTAAYSQDITDNGLALIENGRPKKGIELLQQKFKDEPTSNHAYELACGYVQTGNLMEALDVFNKGIATDSKMPLNHVGKGRVMLDQGNLQEAGNSFDKAMSLSKRMDLQVFNAIAGAWLTKPEFSQRAKDLLTKAEAIQPNVTTSMLLGDAYLFEGNGGKAISNYEYAASLDVRNARPHFKIGNVYIRSTNKEAAMEAFQKAIDIDANYAPAYKELAELYYNSKKATDAVNMQQKYIELVEPDDVNQVRLGFYLFMARDFARANESFGRAYEKGVLKETGLRYYGVSLYENGDYAACQKIFTSYFNRATEQQVEAGDYNTFGKVLLKLDQDSAAVAAFTHSLQIDNKQPAIRQLVAETLFKQKRYPEAIVAYKKLIATKVKPASQDLYSLGRAYYFSNLFMDADTTFNKLIAQQPTLLTSYLWAGRTNVNLDPDSEIGLAKKYYEKVVELGEASPHQPTAELKEAYSYLGYYHLLKNDLVQSLLNWNKVLSIDPTDDRARQAIRTLKP